MEHARTFTFACPSESPRSTALLIRRAADDSYLFLVAQNADLPEDHAARVVAILGRLDKVNGMAKVQARGKVIGAAHIVGDSESTVNIDTMLCMVTDRVVPSPFLIPAHAWGPIPRIDWFVAPHAA